MRVLFLIPASYFVRIFLGGFGGTDSFMGYIGYVGSLGMSVAFFCLLHLCNSRNTFNPLPQKHYGAVYAPWAIN